MPARDKSDFLIFNLVIWNEVNPDEPAIHKKNLEKANFPESGREFTLSYGVNGKAFACVFDEITHTLTVEVKNEDGKTIAPSRVGYIFETLLSPEVLGAEAEEVEVTVIPGQGAIAYVLGLKRLDRVEILVKRPNADDITSDTNRVMRSLIEQRAKSERRILVREAHADGLQLSEANLRRARVGAVNGHVNSAGLDGAGERATRSTKEVPQIVKRAVEAGASFTAALRAIARNARETYEQL